MERYKRQIVFHGIGEEGQAKLAASRVVLCGCGALGTVLAEELARAGVGHLRIVDRDFIELHNLQRQVLFDEDDVREGLPKAEAAARKLRKINSDITIEPIVSDIHHENVLELLGDADLILDGTDNFETRYLINDAAFKLNKPWIYGACIGGSGLTMNIIPGETPCLRCVVESSPPPGMAPTCETGGILGPTVALVASFQAAEALKLLSGHREQLRRELLMFDVWDNEIRKLEIDRLKDAVDCPVCRRGELDWLDGRLGSRASSLCGRNAVHLASARERGRATLSFTELAAQLGPLGAGVTYNKFMLKFHVDEHEFTVFPDGRAIIKGTSDPTKGRQLYSRYIGN